MLREPVHERQEYRLERQIVPEVVHRRCPQHHDAVPHLTLDQGRLTVVVSRENCRGRAGLDRSVAKEPGGGEVTAAGRTEELEDRMAVIDEPDGAAAARPVYRRLHRAGQQRCLRTPGSPLARHNEHTATGVDKPPQRSAHPAWRRRVVEDHHLMILEI